MVAILAVLALGLVFAARTPAAPASGLSWEVHGTGSGTVTVADGGSSSGPAQPQHIGNATYVLTLTNPEQFIDDSDGIDNDEGGDGDDNGDDGDCAIVTGSELDSPPGNGIVASDGSTISWNTVGLLCNEGDDDTPAHYNGTYRITGGTGRFVGVLGGGSLTATFGPTHFIKIDGTITGL
jgi:hypothetical protein